MGGEKLARVHIFNSCTPIRECEALPICLGSEEMHTQRSRASWYLGCGAPSTAKHLVEHRRGDPAGKGVLLARVVAAKQQHLAAQPGRSGQCDLAAVTELRPRPGHREPRGPQHRPCCLPGESAKADD